MLGAVRPGESVRAEMTLRNPHPAAVTVERVETSCPCVRVTPASLHIEPRESAELGIAFDPTDEPDFRGGLRVEVIGRGEGGDVVFRTHVHLEVKAGG